MNCHGLANVSDEEGPVAERVEALLQRDDGGDRSHWWFCVWLHFSLEIMLSNQVFASNLGSQHWHAAEGSRVGYLPHAPLSMDSLMWIGGLGLKPLHAGRGKRQEASCLLRPPYPPLCNCRLPMTSSFGEWTPTKERTLRKKITGEPGGKEGRDTRSKGKAEMVSSMSECLKTNDCVVV